MAQRALTAGMTMPRGRALFGLLDRDGWAWAGIKAAVWLAIIILLLGYIPDRAYYLTVSRTVDLGLLSWSPVNFCAPENKTLPCPAPLGAIVPWDPSPAELALPAARTGGGVVQVGTRIIYIGGSDGATAQSTVYVARTSGVGNFDKWAAGPALPEARSDAAVVFVAGSVFVVGGYGPDGKPTDTVYQEKPDATSGDLTPWTVVDKLKLPAARAGMQAAVTTDGLLLLGGVDASGAVSQTVWKSKLDAQGALGAWTEQQPMAYPQADGAAAVLGDYVWVWSGHDAKGAVGAVQRGDIGKAAAAGLPANPNEGHVIRWATQDSANMPAARDDAAAWSSSGAMYVAGGKDASGAHRELYWAVPSTDGQTVEWKHLDVSDLPVAQSGGAPLVTGPDLVIVGGTSASGTLASSVRGNLAPQAPFFRAGLVGLTVPGLTINGEIGQQLGYLNAAGAGSLDFAILAIIGWAYAHKPQAKAMVGRVLRRGRR